MNKDKNIIVLEDFSMDSPSTKGYVEILSNLEQENNKTLLILSDSNKNIIFVFPKFKKVKSCKCFIFNNLRFDECE